MWVAKLAAYRSKLRASLPEMCVAWRPKGFVKVTVDKIPTPTRHHRH